MTAFAAEFIGTMILIILGCGVNAGVSLNKSYAQNGGWILINFGWGLAVAMAAYAVGQYSGAHLNPALTLALAVIGSFPFEQVPSYLLAQFSGAFWGAVLVYFHYLPHWKATQEPKTKLGIFATGPAIPNIPANLISEIIGTFVLVLAILSIGANEFAKGLNPLIVGFLIVSIGISLGGTTGYAINPARDFSPRLAHFLLPIPDKGSSNWQYAWIPVLGSITGAIYGALFYQAFFKGEIGKLFWLLTVLLVLLFIWAFLNVQKNKEKNDNISSR